MLFDSHLHSIIITKHRVCILKSYTYIPKLTPIFTEQFKPMPTNSAEAVSFRYACADLESIVRGGPNDILF